MLPSRLSHHRERTTPEIRQRTVFVCQSRGLTFHSLRATRVFHYPLHTLVRIFFKYQEEFLCATPSGWVWKQNYLRLKADYAKLFCAAYKIYLRIQYVWTIVQINLSNNVYFSFVKLIAFIIVRKFLNIIKYPFLFISQFIIIVYGVNLYNCIWCQII